MAKMIRFGWLLLLAWATLAQAETAPTEVEAGMVVSGEITVNADGSLVDYSLDKADKISPGVKSFLDEQIRQWTFQPVADAPANAVVVNNMSLRLLAKPAADNAVEVALTGSNFYPVKKTQRERSRIKPPSYPSEAGRAGISADVYLVMKVDADGRVLDVFAEQVNLQVKGDEAQMRRWRQVFADATIDAARRWKIALDDEPSVTGYEVVRVPVSYTMGGGPGYGQWVGYVPGPRASTEWSLENIPPGFSPDALIDGLVYEGGPGTLQLQKRAVDNG